MELYNIKLVLSVPFLHEEEAKVAYEVLRVDQEPPRSKVKKEFFLDQKNLSIFFKAQTAHQLRVGVNSFFDNLQLTIETLESFGPLGPKGSPKYQGLKLFSE